MKKYVSSPVNLDVSNIAHRFDTEAPLDESGDKLLSVCNDGVEKAYIDKDGKIVAPSFSGTVNGVAGTYSIFKAGTFTTLGGDANETVTVTGALATDLAFVQLRDKGATPRTILTAKAGTDKIDMVLSGDPSTDHVICWQVLRANS